MTLLLMRLKLFLTPHLCIIGGLAFKIFKLSARRSYLLIITTIGLASVVGLWNLNEQMQIFGEYSNPEMEDLVNCVVLFIYFFPPYFSFFLLADFVG
jgi:hypothetical protein